MKKIIALLSLCAALLFCFVACEKEKDKEQKPTEQPAETQFTFNTGTPINIPIGESQHKSGHYDAMTIYNSVCKWHHNGGTSTLEIWPHWRDTVKEEFAIRGDLAITVPDGITPTAPGAFAYWRDNILVVALNEDGSVWDIAGLHKDKFMNHFNNEDGIFSEKTEEEIELWREYFEDWMAHMDSKIDTVAYIPNAVMDSMQPLMEQAFYDKDWNRCYDLFKNGYEFIPITGTEYMELVRQGKN